MKNNKDNLDESVDDLDKTMRSIRRMSEKTRLSANMPADLECITISQGGAVGQVIFSLALGISDEYKIPVEEALNKILKECNSYLSFAYSMLDASAKCVSPADETTICDDKV